MVELQPVTGVKHQLKVKKLKFGKVVLSFHELSSWFSSSLYKFARDCSGQSPLQMC